MTTSMLKQITAEFNPDTLDPEQEANIRLVVDDSLDLLQTCKEFAGVVLRSVYPENCYTTGDGLKTATVGEEVTVTLHARDKDDKECTVPIQNLNAELVCSKDGISAECQVKDEDRSKYMIKYKPTTRGNHELHIKIKGKSTKGSPFTVTVTPRTLQTLGNPIRVIENVNTPWGLTTNREGHIIVVENIAACVSVFTLEGMKIRSFGGPGRGKGQFSDPRGVAVDNADNIYVVDNNNHRIQKFTSTGDFTAAVGTRGSDPLQFCYPIGIGFNKKNGKLYVCDKNNCRVQVLETNLTHHCNFGSSGKPFDVAFDSTGNVYVSSSYVYHIETFTPDGQFLQVFVNLRCPCPITIHCDMVYVAVDIVSVFSSESKLLKSFGTRGEAPGQFNQPHGVTVDANGYVLVADRNNHRIQIF